MAKKVKAWVSYDDKIFLNKKECEEYESEHALDMLIATHRKAMEGYMCLKKISKQIDRTKGWS